MNEDTFLFKTNNSDNKWLKAKRIILFLLILIVVLLWDVNSFSLLIKLATLIVAYLAIRVYPIEEIAVDENHLYFIYSSKYRRFSKEIKYPIAEITSFRCAGFYTKTNDLIDSITPKFMGVFPNSIELSFQDGTSASLDSLVYKKDIIKAITVVYEQKALLKDL